MRFMLFITTILTTFFATECLFYIFTVGGESESASHES